jgi:dCMP deaminase
MSSDAVWQRRYLDLARHVAEWSKDPSTKVGTVIVGLDRRELCVGYNGFPPGIADDEDRLADRKMKYALTQHAERNALDNARFDLRGGLLATTMYPCSECTKSIISRGIARIICPAPLEREPWAADALVAGAMLREAGVEVCVYLSPAENPG